MNSKKQTPSVLPERQKIRLIEVLRLCFKLFGNNDFRKTKFVVGDEYAPNYSAMIKSKSDYKVYGIEGLILPHT